MTRKHWYLILIILLAALLRFYKLSKVPASLNWDETAIGWNAKTMFHTRRDEYGSRLPLSFKSFGDYKAPVYIYLTAPIVGVFGMNEVSVRLLSVLAGVGSVGIIYFLVKELSSMVPRLRPPAAGNLSLLSSLLLATAPWHILLSRPAFEQNLALFFILFGSWCLLLGMQKKPFWLLPSALGFAASFYTYHSPKIFVPVFLAGAFIIFLKNFVEKKRIFWTITALALAMIVLLPLGHSMVFGGAGARFQGTSIFYTKEGGLKPFDFKLFSELGKNYLSHYSPNFLFFGNNIDNRIQMKETGQLLLIEAPFLLLGLFELFKSRKEKWSQFLLWWFFTGPAAAVVGFEVPHPIRAFNLLPVLVIIISVGIIKAIDLNKRGFKSSFLLRKFQLKTDLFGGALIILFVINASWFLYHYFLTYPVYSASKWQYGYKEAVQVAQEYEDRVDKIIMTSHYGQPHIFTLFFQNRKPQDVFWGAMSKYLYRDLKWDEDPNRSNILLIGAPSEIPENALGLIKEILFPDGSVAFRVVKTAKKT